MSKFKAIINEIERGNTERNTRITALESMLRELEWADRDPVHGDECPICGFKPESSHAPDCRLKALLEGKS